MGIGVPAVQILDPDTGLPVGVVSNPLTVQPTSAPAAPAAADILSGFTATDAATVITIPAGRTWRGYINLSGNITNGATNTAAVSSVISVTTAGAGVIPAAATVLARIRLNLAANTASGVMATVTQGNVTVPDVIVAAPAGNAATLVFNISAGAGSGAAHGLLL